MEDRIRAVARPQESSVFLGEKGELQGKQTGLLPLDLAVLCVAAAASWGLLAALLFAGWKVFFR